MEIAAIVQFVMEKLSLYVALAVVLFTAWLWSRRKYVGGWIPIVGAGLELAQRPEAFSMEIYEKAIVNAATESCEPYQWVMIGTKPMLCVFGPQDIKHMFFADLQEMSFWEGLHALGLNNDLLPLGLTGPEENHRGTKLLKKTVMPKLSFRLPDIDDELSDHMRQLLKNSSSDNDDPCRSGGHPWTKKTCGHVAHSGLPHMHPLFVFQQAFVGTTARLFLGNWATACYRNPEVLERLGRFEVMFARFMHSGGWDTKTKNEGKRIRLECAALIQKVIDDFLEEHPEEHPLSDAFDAKKDEAELQLGVYLRGMLQEGISTHLIACEIFAMMFAAIANTHAAATFMLHQIISNPEFLVRAREEIDLVFGSNEDTGEDFKLDKAGFNSMKFLKMCFKETARMIPGPMHARLVVKTIVMPGCRQTVQAGEFIGLAQIGVHYDKEIFPEPNVFMPDRWDSSKGKELADPARMLAFGRGLHMCPGMSLAEIECVVGVARALQLLPFDALPLPPEALPKYGYGTSGLAQPVADIPLVMKPKVQTVA
eukprot:Clim_evm13s229 gene=Clim_evmTU13s229